MTTLVRNHAAKSGAKVNVGPMFQEGSYVLAVWTTTDGNAGGQTLAKTGAKMQLIVSSGGSLNNLTELEMLGVPTANAKALVADLTKADL